MHAGMTFVGCEAEILIGRAYLEIAVLQRGQARLQTKFPTAWSKRLSEREIYTERPHGEQFETSGLAQGRIGETGREQCEAQEHSNSQRSQQAIPQREDLPNTYSSGYVSRESTHIFLYHIPRAIGISCGRPPRQNYVWLNHGEPTLARRFCSTFVLPDHASPITIISAPSKAVALPRWPLLEVSAAYNEGLVPELGGVCQIRATSI